MTRVLLWFVDDGLLFTVVAVALALVQAEKAVQRRRWRRRGWPTDQRGRPVIPLQRTWSTEDMPRETVGNKEDRKTGPDRAT